MNAIWFNISLSFGSAIFGAILGAVLGWILAEPYRLPTWIALRRHTNLNGVWICGWTLVDSDSEPWCYDRVRLTHRMGKLRVEIIESRSGYDWEARLSFERAYFRGFWESRLPNASARGAMMLKLFSQGDSLAGYWIGDSQKPKLTAGRIIIAKTQSEAKRLASRFLEYL